MGSAQPVFHRLWAPECCSTSSDNDEDDTETLQLGLKEATGLIEGCWYKSMDELLG